MMSIRKAARRPSVVTDIIGRAAELGGWLTVSFVAPVPPSPWQQASGVDFVP